MSFSTFTSQPPNVAEKSVPETTAAASVASSFTQETTWRSHPWVNFRVIANIIVIGLGICLLSYDSTVISPIVALPFFIEKYQPNSDLPAFSADNLGLIVSIPLCGSLVATFLAPYLLATIGRRRSLLVAYVIFSAPGSFLQLFAPNLVALIFGRVINYIGMGIMSMTIPIYLCELVPAEYRGRTVGTIMMLYVVTSTLGATLVWGTEKIHSDLQYKIPFAVQAAAPCIFGFFTTFVTESPVSSLLRNLEAKAGTDLRKLRPKTSTAVSAEFDMMREAVRAAKEIQNRRNFWNILNTANIKRTLVGSAYLPFTQASGTVLVSVFGTVILVQIGVADAFRINVLINCLSIVAQAIGPFAIDKFGRRPVVISGLMVLFALNISTGSVAAAGLTSDAREQAIAGLFIMISFCSTLTFGSVLYLLPVELPTLTLREPTVAWANFWSAATSMALSFILPQMIAADAGNLGAKAALVFGGCNVVMLLVSYFYLPETKGLTMAEIDKMYAAKIPERHWKKQLSLALRNQV